MREVRVKRKLTKEGPDYRISLYDDRGRFVLTARTFTLGASEIEQMGEFLETGRHTAFSQTAVRLSLDVR